jgi:hypothetical protein
VELLYGIFIHALQHFKPENHTNKVLNFIQKQIIYCPSSTATFTVRPAQPRLLSGTATFAVRPAQPRFVI